GAPWPRMLPPAPPRLTTTICWPQASFSFCPTRRVTMSVAPPGGNGQMMRTGFDGYVWASDGIASRAAKSAAMKTSSSELRIFLLLPASLHSQRLGRELPQFAAQPVAHTAVRGPPDDVGQLVRIAVEIVQLVEFAVLAAVY